MTATLRLTPLSRNECIARLEQKGKVNLHGPVGLPSVDASLQSASAEYDCPRRALTLKMCLSTEDVVDLDSFAASEGIVRYRLPEERGRVAVVLGRNAATGIKWTSVSRALCDVSLATRTDGGRRPPAAPRGAAAPDGAPSDSGKGQSEDDGLLASLRLRKPAGSHYIHLDGELVQAPPGEPVALAHGAVVALYGPTGFAYEVAIAREDEREGPRKHGEGNPKKRKADDRPAENKEDLRREVRRRARALETGECACAYCLEVLVEATCAYPCMHAFCKGCARLLEDADRSSDRARTRKGTCITCRGKVEGWGAARSLDALVWAAALQGKFARDDAAHYLARRALGGADPPSEIERDCILNRGGDDDDGGGGGARAGGAGEAYVPLSPSRRPRMPALPPPFPAAVRSGGPHAAGHGDAATLPRPSRVPKPSINDVICID